jgi:hypothetical protein
MFSKISVSIVVAAVSALFTVQALAAKPSPPPPPYYPAIEYVVGLPAMGDDRPWAGPATLAPNAVLGGYVLCSEGRVAVGGGCAMTTGNCSSSYTGQWSVIYSLPIVEWQNNIYGWHCMMKNISGSAMEVCLRVDAMCIDPGGTVDVRGVPGK